VAEPDQEQAVELARSVHVAVAGMLMARDWSGLVGLLGQLKGLPVVKRGEA
jgi:hypothetical protein